MTSAKDQAETGTAARRWPTFVLTAAVVLVVVAASFAGWFGVGWIKAANDDSINYSRARDEVARVGQVAIITFHTLDYRKVDEGLDAWQNASTGDLHNEVVGRRASSKQAIEQAKTATKAELLKWSDGADAITVTELDEREGKAEVIAAVKVTVTPEGKQPEDKRMRILGTLQRTETGDWKLSGIGQVQFAPAQ